MGYDAFISYSHGADGELAADLQESLQRFSKPWYRRTPFVSVVRDASSFGASASLAGTIHEALDEADHFVLLLSPESAESPWINDEVAHWIETKGVESMTFVITRWKGDDLSTGPGLTDLGKFRWDGADVPVALHGVVDEPLAVDLRWARSPAHRTLRNDAWRDDIAEIAASIRDQNKDELIGTVVAMRTRARMLTTSILLGAAILLFATVLGVGGWVLANRARTEAVDDRNLAQSQQADAVVARDEAQSAQREAIDQAEAAQAAQLTAEQAAAAADEAAEAAQASLAKAESAVAAAEADLENAQTELVDTRNNLTSTKQDLAVAETNLAGAEIALETARQDLLDATAAAERQTTIAHSVATASRSIALLNDDPRAAALVGLAAFDIADTPQSRDALVTLGQRSNIVATVSSAGGKPITWARFAFIGDGGRLVAADGRNAGIHNAQTGRLITSLPPADEVITDLAYSEASGLLAVADEAGIGVWDIATETLLNRFEGHLDDPGNVAWSPDGRIIASTSSSELLVWEAATGITIARQQNPNEGGTTDVAISPDGTLIVTGGFTDIRFWDAVGTPIGDSIDTGPSLNFVSLAFSPDGSRLASTSSVAVLVWDTVAKTQVGRVTHTDIVTGVAFSRSGRWLATSAADETVRIWDVETETELARPLPEVAARLEFGPGDGILAAGSSGQLSIVDVTHLDPSNSAAVVGGPVGAVSVGGDVMAIAEDSRIRFVDAHTGQEAAPDLVMSTPVTGLAFDRSDSRLVVAAGDQLSVHDLTTSSITAGPYRTPGAIQTMAVSGDGERVAASDGVSVWLFTLPSGTITRIYEPSLPPVQSVAFDATGGVLKVLTGGADAIVTTIDLLDGSTAADSFSFPLGLSAIIAPGLETVAVGTARETFRLYNGATGDPIGDELGQRLPPGVFALPSLSFSPDGQHLAIWTPTRGGWDVIAGGIESWQRRACERAGRNLTLEEWHRFLPPAIPYAIQCEAYAVGD